MTERPVLRIVRGEPTAEELAVVAALVGALGDGAGSAAGDSSATAPRRGTWSDPALRVRQPMRPGLGAWRAAAR